jgi:uncharacterized membrane protein YoaK (UPF0700 family)
VADPAAVPIKPPASSWLHDERHGPLPFMLLVLTMVTGLIDAVSYLGLGHVFVANMTGNVVFMGFAAGGSPDFSIPASLVALGSFLAGALGGGCLATSVAGHRGRLIARATWIEIALIVAALAVSIAVPGDRATLSRYLMIVLLGGAMGLQNATARRLAVPDLTTTVLTLTLTGLAADSTLAGGKNPNPGRRVIATITMFAAAALGAFILFRVGINAVLGLIAALLVLSALHGYRFSSSTEPWAAPPSAA